MQSTSIAVSPHRHLGPVGWIGRFVLGVPGYVGGVAILTFAAAGWPLWSRFTREAKRSFSFWKTLIYQLSWMLFMGIPLVGLVHIAMGSFLSLQAYYGSTFVDGTGAVVGVGLLRNLGGLMTGMTFAGHPGGADDPGAAHPVCAAGRAAKSVPADLSLMPETCDEGSCPEEGVLNSVTPSGLAAPRIAAAGIACLLLSLWGITVGTVVGWKASESLMGLSTEMFFMMMLKMMWFRDVLGLIVKGILFGALPAAICCYEGLGRPARR